MRQQIDGMELSEVGGWWALKTCGKDKCVWRATPVGEDGSGLQAREWKESEKGEREDGKPRGGVIGMAVWHEHENKGQCDRDGGNP